MQKENYFSCPIWIEQKPEFLNLALAGSERHIKEARKNNKELIKNLENKFISTDLAHESRDIKKNIPKIIEAREISDDEANYIQESKKLEDKYALHKYFLRKIFNYTKELNEDMIKFGKSNFSFEILRFCDNKSQMAYFEAKEQFDKNFIFISPDEHSPEGVRAAMHKLRQQWQPFARKIKPE